MPNTHATLTSLFSDIADAIRGKTGSSAAIVADNFPTAIASIPTGGSATIQPLSVTANGTYTAPSGVDGYSPITVNVPKNAVTTTEVPNSTGTALYINSTGGSSWVRPFDWPDLSKMDVSGGDILYMTSYADEPRGFCSFTVRCTGSYTVEVGTISGSTFTAESTQTFSSDSNCRLYYGSANGTYKVLRVTGTNISAFMATGTSSFTIDTFHGYEPSQGIIDVVGKLPSCTTFNWQMYNLINVEVDSLVLHAVYFSACYSLTNLDVSNWDTSSVTNMSSMFNNCCSLTNLDVSNWDTSSVTDMGSMFSGCRSLRSLDVSNWDTSSVKGMSSMFYECHSLASLDVSNWDTSLVTNMSYMFSGCYSIKNLNVSSWNTSSVTRINAMFQHCDSLTTLDVSNWNTSSVTEMSSVFLNCYSLVSLDVSNWDFSSITETSKTNSMFNSCNSLNGSLTLPSSFAFIGTTCFSSCQSLYEWHFLATTPPTLANTNAFSNMTAYGGKKIYVPSASLTAYQEATNWSTYASYMVGE